MTTATTPSAKERYLETVRLGLSDLPADDVEEVIQDLATHLGELGEIDPAASLGSPETFIEEFRASAGLDQSNTQTRSRILRHLNRIVSNVRLTTRRALHALAPVIGPLQSRRGDLRIAWIWTRGVLLLSAYWWVTDAWPYGNQEWLLGDSPASRIVQLLLATTASVWLAGRSGKWIRRGDKTFSIAAAGLIFLAIISPRYISSPDEFVFAIDDYAAPGQLVGPNGPISNVYAYDTEGNPVQVLLYDEAGNPLYTLPEYAYEEAASLSTSGAPFLWEGIEFRFVQDIYGRPVGNLYPLGRYMWLGPESTSTEYPPPVVGIPELQPGIGTSVGSGDGTAPSGSPEPGSGE